MGSSMGRGNQYIQLVKVLYCKQMTIGKQLSHTVWALNHRPQRWEASVFPLHHCGPQVGIKNKVCHTNLTFIKLACQCIILLSVFTGLLSTIDN